MIGADRVIQTRMAGYRPFTPIVLHAVPADWARIGDEDGYVQVLPAERVERLDLRFVVGLPAWVLGDDWHRVHELAGAVMRAGASGVAGMFTGYSQRKPVPICAAGDLAFCGDGAHGQFCRWLAETHPMEATTNG